MDTPSWSITIDVDPPYADELDALDPGLLERALRAVLAWSRRGRAAVSVVITDDDAVRALNRDYRGVDAVTDVLSFAAQEGDGPPGELPPDLAAELEETLGDLIIAYPYAARQAARYGHSLAAELQLLVVHGCLHLLGYDHDTPERQAEMWRVQGEILASLVDEDLTRRMEVEA